MKRPRFRAIPVVFFLAAIAINLLAPSVTSQPVSAASRPPNILFILTDDQDVASLAYMPKVKALLEDQGVTFNNYFVNISLCCPSRSTILRAQYSHNTGVLTNDGNNGGFQQAFNLGVEKSTIATWLQAGGYQTALYGKYLNGYPGNQGNGYLPPGWNEWASSVQGNPYSEYDYVLNQNGKLAAHKHQPEDYGTDVYSGLATDFIQRTVKENKPFFVYLAVYAPHQPATPAPQDLKLFPGLTAPRPPSFDEADVSDKPQYISERDPLTPANIKVIDNLYRRRIQSLQDVDRNVEALINTLKTLGQLDNTYIVFTSDNGFHLGAHRMVAGKQSPYEMDIRVPLIIRGPGIPTGQTRDQIVGTIDLGPTFMSWAGLKPPDFVDGRSMVPLFTDNPPGRDKWRQVFLLEHWDTSSSVEPAQNAEPGDPDQPDPNATPEPDSGQILAKKTGPLVIPEFQGLKTANYTYIEYVTGEKEFYDLRKDPDELENMASKADPGLLKQFADRLSELRKCKADTCRAAEDKPLGD